MITEIFALLFASVRLFPQTQMTVLEFSRTTNCGSSQSSAVKLETGLRLFEFIVSR